MKTGLVETDEYGTPKPLFCVLREEFNFTLDVCATKENALCEDYHTKETDGLNAAWQHSNWCNPPYSNLLPWVQRADSEAENRGFTSVCLIKHDPSTRHGQLIAHEADELRILLHRIKFVGATQAANFPVALAVFRRRLYTRKTNARILYCDFRNLLGVRC